MEKTTYILQKDTLAHNGIGGYIAKKGTELRFMEGANRYVCPGNMALWFQKELVETQPEWFKKEEPKPEWQVYALLGRDTGNLYKLSENGLYLDKNQNGFSWSADSKDASLSIYSVTRISDGTVWRLKQTTLHGVIEKISFVDNNLVFEIKNTTIDYLYPMFINELQQAPANEVPDLKSGYWAVPKDSCTISYEQPKSKPEEPLPIKVHAIHFYVNNEPQLEPTFYHQLVCSARIPPSKYEPIKKLLEDFLNSPLGEILTYEQYKARKYTSDELLEAQEKWYNIGKGVAAQNSPDYKPYVQSIENQSLNK